MQFVIQVYEVLYKKIKDYLMKKNNIFSKNAHWLLRIAVASVFFYHGLLKFSDLNLFTQMLPIPYTQVVLVASSQVIGSLLIVLGGFGRDRLSDIATRIGALINIPVMVGAVVLVHWGRWNFVPTEAYPMGGMEFQVVLALIMSYLVLTGNQRASAVVSEQQLTEYKV
jgi:putative oxidoreductase